MGSLQALAVLMALSAPGETVLLDFSATWCGPCQMMNPVVEQLSAAGFPVRKVDVDREQALANQYGVTGVPCFVMLVNGREVERTSGVTSYQQLAKMCQLGKQASNDQPRARAQSPDDEPVRNRLWQPTETADRAPTTFAEATAPIGRASGGDSNFAKSDRRDRSQDQRPPNHGAQSPAVDRMVAATVRLRVKDDAGYSNGTGTIVDASGGEALILTCGHLFRDSQGKGEITIDLFGDQQESGVPGRLIAYDDKLDVGFVSFRPRGRVTAAKIAPRGFALRKGDPVVNVGCDHGDDPTAKNSQITSTRKFLGPPHVMAAGAPVLGRSGGGLFSADGLVVGVCNAADEEDDEGMYAALETIHAQLDRLRLSFVYENTPAPAANLREESAPRDNAPRESAPRNELVAAFDRDNGSAPHAEVVCVVRSLDDPNAKSEVIVLDRATPALLEQLRRESEVQQGRHLTSDRVERNARRTPAASPVAREPLHWRLAK